MEQSILVSTKKILGIEKTYTAFDLDIITHINSTFSILTQIGLLGPNGFLIDGEYELWDELSVPETWLNLIKTYVFLKVRMLFDPPATTYHINAMEKQISEIEWRLNSFREGELWTAP